MSFRPDVEALREQGSLKAVPAGFYNHLDQRIDSRRLATLPQAHAARPNRIKA